MAKGTGGPAGDEHYNLVAQLYDMTHADEVIRPVEPGKCPTLNARMDTCGNQVPVMMEPVAAVDCRNLCENVELSATPQAKSVGGHSLNYQNPVRIGYAVRRLTPTECERLMGFPDNWTAGGSDTARYKALGNSVAVPCVEFIMRRLAEAMQGD